MRLAELPIIHPSLKEMYRLFGELRTTTAAHRFNMHALNDALKDQWKVFHDVDLKQIKNKQDAANKALSTMEYWKKEHKLAKQHEFELKYKQLSLEFIEEVHSSREKKEQDVPNMLLTQIQTELQFYTAVIQELQKVEAQFRRLGPVTANKVNLSQFIPTAPSESGDQPLGGQKQIAYTPANAPAGAPPGRPALTYNYPQAKALFAFAPQGADELGFQPGEILTIVSQDGMWWQAKNAQGKQGAIPSNYVQLM